jgi:hypothetical protein
MKRAQFTCLDKKEKTSFQMYDPTINRPCDKTTLRWVHLAMNRDAMNRQTS